MERLWVSAGIEVQNKDDVARAKKALINLVQETLKEPGCLNFRVLHNMEKPQCFTLWECWQDEQAFKAHFEAPHTKAYLAKEFTQINYIERLCETSPQQEN